MTYKVDARVSPAIAAFFVVCGFLLLWWRGMRCGDRDLDHFQEAKSFSSSKLLRARAKTTRTYHVGMKIIPETKQ